MRGILVVLLIARLGSGSQQQQQAFVQRMQKPGLWLPEDHRITQTFMETTAAYVATHPRELVPAVSELESLIQNDSRIFLLASGMYEDMPENYTDPSWQPVVRNYTQMLHIMSHLTTQAPLWSQHENYVGLVGLPMHALLDWPMGTFHGFGFFLDPAVNAALRRILNEWSSFLSSPASAHVLNNSTSGWLGAEASEVLVATANVGGTQLSFEDLFVCDPAHATYGFESWDAFFTRRFRPGVRPLSAPDDDSVLANVCESLPFAVSHDVQLRSKFWVKGQPYSVHDMLGGDKLAERFVGGTIYQAYLSLLSYHRWHSPVNGKVVKVTTIAGTYFSEPMFEILDKYGAFPRAPRHAQGYLSAVATRAITYIQADNPAIGLIAVVQIGMSEVSSCEVTVQEGERVRKGDEIGMFHFGGSTFCLMFEKGINVTGFPQPGAMLENVPVRGYLAEIPPSENLLAETERSDDTMNEI